MGEEIATDRRHGEMHGESDADIVFTAELFCHDLTDNLGTCVFCGGNPYHEVDIGVGYERVAVVCCENGVEYYDTTRKRDEFIVSIGSKLESARCLHAEAARLIEELVKRVKDHMSADERAQVRAAWDAS